MADGTVRIGTELDGAGLSKGLKGLGGFAKKGFSAIGGAAVSMAKASTAAIGAVSAGVAAAGTASIAAGKEFESSFAKASTLFGDVSVDTDNLKKKMLEVSDATGVAADELNQSLYSALSAGIPVTEDMSEATAFLESSAKLAKAGFTDMDTALSATAKTLNAYGLDSSEADRIQKILIQTQNKGITTVGELGASLSQVTPTAAAFGVSFENVGAALANMTAAGTPTAQATTQLNGLIAELGKKGTTGAKSLEKAAKGTQYAGMSFKQMMDAGVPLNDVLDLIRKSADDSGLSMVDMFSSIDAGKAALALSGENSAKFAENLEAMGTSADVVTEAYDKVSDTLENKTGLIKNSAKNLGISIFNGIQEPLGGLADLGVQAMNDLSKAFKTDGLTGLIQAGAGIVSKIVLGIAQHAPDLIKIAVDTIQTFIGSIEENLPQFVEAGGGLITSLVGGVLEVIPSLAGLGLDILNTLLDSIIEGAPAIGTQGAELINGFITSLSDAIPTLLAKGAAVITSLASGISAALPQIMPVAVRAILGFAQGLVNNAPSLLDAGLKMLQSLAEGIAASLPTIIEMVPKLINSFADTVYASLPKILAAGVKILITLGKGIIDSIPTIIANAGEIIKAIINVISMASLLNLGKSLIRGLINGIKGMGTSLAQSGESLMRTLVNKIKTTDWLSVGKNIIKGIINGLKSVAGDLVKAAAGAVDDALNWVKQKLGIHSPSRVFRDEVGKNIALGIAEGITQNKDYAKKSLEEIADAILSAARKKLDNTKVYQNLSLADEAAYWDSVRKQVQDGTQARVDADKEYFAAKKKLDDKLLDIEKSYADKVTKTQSDLQKNISSLWDKYQSDLKSRTKDIASSMNLFDPFEAKTEQTTASLLDNLKSQVTGLKEWSGNLKDLENRGVSADMMEELRGMGVSAAGEIQLMTQMTDEELDQYVSLWKQKQRLARKEAQKELEPLLQSTRDQIAQMQADAATQLDAYKQEYINAMAEIGAGIQQPLAEVRDSLLETVSSAVQAVAGTVSSEADSAGNTKKFSELSNQVLEASKGLPGDLMVLGQDAIAGLIQGLKTKSGDLYTAMAGIIHEAVEAAKEAAQIHSPSRLMRDLIGRNMIAGIGVGFDLEAPALNKKARRVTEDTVAAMQQASVKDFVAGMRIQPLRTTVGLDRMGHDSIYRSGSRDGDEGAGTLVLEKGSIETSVILDGRVAAKATGPYMDKNMGASTKKKDRG